MSEQLESNQMRWAAEPPRGQGIVTGVIVGAIVWLSAIAGALITVALMRSGVL